MKTARRAALVCLLGLGRMLPARAQVLPDQPVSLANGHVTISGDVSATAIVRDVSDRLISVVYFETAPARSAPPTPGHAVINATSVSCPTCWR